MSSKLETLAKMTHVRVATPAVLAVVAAGLGGALTYNHNETVVRDEPNAPTNEHEARDQTPMNTRLASGYAHATAASALLLPLAALVGGVYLNHNETVVRDQ
jgi:hypothetical protein